MADNPEPKGWWQTIPGILTATAGIITAVTSLIVALHQAGIVDRAAKVPSGSQHAMTTADLIAGKWSGEAKTVNGTSFQIEIDIRKPCTLQGQCGSIRVSHVPCSGELFFHALQQGTYEFRVDNFTPNSSAQCTPGAGEHFQLLADGMLFYTTTYDPKAQGILQKKE